MDPHATFLRLLDALQQRDTEDARQAFEDLADWIKSGGFVPPSIPAAFQHAKFGDA